MLSNPMLRLALLAGAAIMAIGLGPHPACSDEPLPIAIGIQSDNNWLIMTARTEHLFEKAGLKPNFVKFTAGAPMMAAAQSQSIDVACLGLVPFIAGLGQGIPWVTIGLTPVDPNAEGIVVRKDAGIDKIADLKGKKIGFFRASTAHYGLFMALDKNQVPIDRVTLLSLAPAQQLAAMRNKEIDAAEVWQPWIEKMILEANGKLLAMEGDFGVHTADGTFAVRTDWLAKNREAALRFMRGVMLAEAFLKKDPEPAIKTFAAETGIDDKLSAQIYKDAPPPEVQRWIDPEYQFSLVKGGALQRELATLADFLFREKVIPAQVDVDNVLDDSIVRDALNSDARQK
ncbi:MAG TPA: aliphatic sulfonate ABC transporter substrate-binding protein [Stellaceae bacterium]|nr:aliphatic sulfonate ABC transporter substrate-binding protein [Stellaceae bacterium]